MGALGILFQKGGLSLGVPFDWKIMELLGLHGDLRFLSLNANELFAGLFGAVLGLGLSEAAYMAEIARAGILSVDPGQSEAAQAIGMNRGQAMRRVILPQAMRVIVPPTGNETIAMLKDTSLLIAIPLGDELFFQLTSIGSRTYRTFEVLVAAVIFYLIATSVLMVGQYYIERHFGRGFGRRSRRPSGSRARPGLEAPDALRQRHRRRAPAAGARGQRDEVLPRHRGAQGHRPDVSSGQVVCLLGPVRVGQDDVPALHQPARDHRRRPDLGRRRADGLRGARRQAAPAVRQADRRTSAATSAWSSSAATCSRT